MATRRSTDRRRTGRSRAGRATARPKRARSQAKVTAKKTGSRNAARKQAGLAHRLAPDVRPVRAEVHVEVDPAAGRAFRGEVHHQLELEHPRRSVELHAADLRVSRARAETRGVRLRGSVRPHPERETVEVRFDRPLPAGEATLSLGFAGRLRDDLRGLYAASSGERPYALTQLEAADARRFFPCFDEPALKARFALSVTTASGHTVLSNSPVAKVEPLGRGRKTVHFEPTPPLSTYLLALAVGELEASEATRCGETEIRVWHVPGKGHLTGFALEAARETLARLEAYFDLPYPYEKLDLVAAPDFEAGAMENAGAVFFRETLLLLDPATVTLQEKKRAAEVICHELAHMWYGDLVTMAWWDDLWLNEAFATWMAFHVVDAWKPEWKMWHDFQHYRSAALGMDALAHTHPIYTQVRTPSDATENFDLITYEKGAAVVRMLERYLGAGPFRAGVRRYIRRHREGNAEAADLWRALDEASGQEVEPVVRAWIEQPGFPLLHVKRTETEGGTRLAFRQERFRLGKARAGAASQRWAIPWVGRLGSASGRRTKTTRALLTRARESVTLEGRAPRFVYGNADEGGFFRPLHGPAELRALTENLDLLSPVERMGLLGHQWASVRAGRARLGGFLELARACSGENDPDVLLSLRGPLAFVDDRIAPVAGEGARDALRGRIVASFGAGFEALGFDPAKDEDDEARMRRAALLSLVGEVAEWQPVVAEAGARCRAYLADRGSLDPNLADGVVSLGARRGDRELFERFLAAAEAAQTPQDRRRMLMALGGFQEPALVKRALGLALTRTIGTQDVALLLTRLLQNPAAREAAWEFMKRRWPALRRRLPPMLVTRPIEATPGLGTRAHRRDVAAFFRANPVPTAVRAVRQALERFDLDLALVEREAPGLARWLDRG